MLTNERIRELWENYSPTQGIESFARSVEAEASAQDTALIRQLVEALETCGDDDGYNGPSQHYETVPVEEAVAAGRARLNQGAPQNGN